MRTTRRHAVAQVVGRWLVIAEAWVNSQVSPLAFVVDSDTGTVFYPSTLVYPARIIQPVFHINSSVFDAI
jgi:hypothetical protein